MFEYAFMQNAFIVAVLISIVCPLIGIFLVLRRYSMIGDALSHASLAGVAIGLLLDANPILSAFGLTSVFGILIEVLRQRFRQYAELILVIILSLSVGIAITIISSGMVHTNVESFLFGSILTVTREDVWSVLLLSIVSILTIIKLYLRLCCPRRGDDFRVHPDRRHPGHQFAHCTAGSYGAAAAEGISPDYGMVRPVQLFRYYSGSGHRLRNRRCARRRDGDCFRSHAAGRHCI